ncbi:MAG: MDR family MFS transporter [Anaerolineae bacterium]
MSYSAAQRAPSDSGPLAYKWKVLISVIFGIFMVILDSTVVNVAFQTLRREYGASLNESQWIISVYVLALGIGTPLAGYLADRYSLKRVYIAGLSLFVVGSFLCGLAPSLWLLIAARILQGFGGGIAVPLGPALLFSAFPTNEQGKALGFFGIALVVAPALGPILGGWLVDHDLWRWIFFINVPIGIVGIYLASRWLRYRPTDRRPSLDVIGLIIGIVGISSILYGASIASDQGWGSTQVVTMFVVGAIGLAAFSVVELFFAKEPLLDLRLFQNRVFLNASLVGYVSVMALFGAEFLMPIYLQALRGLTALQAGLTLLPLAIAAGITTPTAGRLYDKIGPRPIVVFGFSILAINTWQLSQIRADTSITWIMFLLFLRGIALGSTVQTTLVTALSPVPNPKIARASSLINSSRQIVQAVGVAFLATVLASTLSPAGARVPDPDAGRRRLPPTADRHHDAANVDPRHRGPAARALRASPGFERAYTVTFFFALAALIIGAFLPGWPLKWAGRRPAGEGQSPPVPAGH